MSETNKQYFPPAEQDGGWRYGAEPAELRDVGGVDPVRLDFLRESQARIHVSSSVVIVRHGHVIAEWNFDNAVATDKYNIYSCTKSFTGTAFGMLLDDAMRDAPGVRKFDLDTLIYPYIPVSLSDTRKEKITLRHLLTMTSGISGESVGISGLPTAHGVCPFEASVGLAPFSCYPFYRDRWVGTLASPPGSRWDYSDPAFAHLSILFSELAGEKLSAFVERRLLAPIGIGAAHWDSIGESAELGRHTSSHSGIYMTARDLARFGYLCLRGGRWEGNQVVPEWWQRLATDSLEGIKREYGYTWWVNKGHGMWQNAPEDTFAAFGFRCNRCYVIPSLDLVIVRVGAGPRSWREGDLIQGVVAAVVR